MRISITMNGAALPDVESRTAAGAGEALMPMDEASFRAFYDRTARPLWLYLQRMTGDGHAADDLMQETYYRFYRAGATHESESHRRNSLFHIATNLVRDARRRGKLRNHVVPADEEHEHLLVDNASARGAEGRTDLARALGRLRPQQRAMIWLAYAFGSSHEEIASIVGVKTSSVKPLLHRARRKLAEILGRSQKRSRHDAE